MPEAECRIIFGLTFLLQAGQARFLKEHGDSSKSKRDTAHKHGGTVNASSFLTVAFNEIVVFSVIFVAFLLTWSNNYTCSE